MLVFDGNPSLYRLAGTCPAVVFYFYFHPPRIVFDSLYSGGTQYKLKLYPSPRLVPIWIDMLELSCWMRLASSENWVLLKIRPKKPESIYSKSLCRLGIVRVCRSRSRNSVSLSLSSSSVRAGTPKIDNTRRSREIRQTPFSPSPLKTKIIYIYGSSSTAVLQNRSFSSDRKFLSSFSNISMQTTPKERKVYTHSQSFF
jgi:hypothetical protein